MWSVLKVGNICNIWCVMCILWGSIHALKKNLWVKESTKTPHPVSFIVLPAFSMMNKLNSTGKDITVQSDMISTFGITKQSDIIWNRAFHNLELL